MEVDFRTNLGDIIQANFYMLPRSKAYRILGVILVAVMGYISYYLASAPNITTLSASIVLFITTFLLSLAIAVIVMVLVQLILLSLGFLFDLKDQTREYKLSTTANGIKLETAVARKDMYWSDIRKITRTNNHLYILVADGAAIIVPQRAFAGPEQAAQFCETITALWNTNKNNPHE